MVSYFLLTHPVILMPPPYAVDTNTLTRAWLLTLRCWLLTVCRPSEEGHRYIYFNHMNLAVKTSVKNRQLFASAEVIRALNQLHADFERYVASKHLRNHEYGHFVVF